MTELIDKIEGLKREFNLLKPLKPAHQQRLDKKLRLEWNYNSNHIEGNTLTYGETELLIIFDQTKGNHEFREYDEMKGHDVAMGVIKELAADEERTLTESFIRDINRILLKTPFYKEAITADGQPTRRLISVGEYKSMPNSVRLQNGEMFHYASPQETPALMQDLLNWYRGASQDLSKHAIETAAELHYRFVCIHPFDDGNGRISRLLMNYHLLKNDFPPVIIKSAEKRKYLFALNEADAGNLKAFQEYIGEQLTWSYEISIKAAKGEVIDETKDWEKELSIFKKRLKSNEDLSTKRSALLIQEIIEKDIIKLARVISNSLNSFDDLFNEKSKKVAYESTSIEIDDEDQISTRQIIEAVVQSNELRYTYFLLNYKYNGFDHFDVNRSVSITFNEFYYDLSFGNGDEEYPNIRKKYTEKLHTEETNAIAASISKSVLKQIKLKSTKTPFD